jgi:hypothetical protein
MSFASVHEPLKDHFGAPYLDSGRPVTVEFLRTLAHELGWVCAPRFFPRKYWTGLRTARCGGSRLPAEPCSLRRPAMVGR